TYKGDFPVKGFIWKRLDVEIDCLILMDQVRVFFLYGGSQLQWMHSDDHCNLRLLPHIFTTLYGSLGNCAWNRRADDRIIQFFLREIIGSTPVLKTGLQRSDILKSHLVVSFADLDFGLVCIQFSSRKELFGNQFLGVRQLRPCI